ncbi:hypothetical protein ACJIZ3_015614 [Penstemon smallii]|uniref:Squalene monooxygenase n=1 Tax=Penstemon smallii TaxID=265156 RepID=A0ABD3RTJ7_9LAMI
MYNAFISSIDKGTSIRIMPINSMPAAPYLVPGAILLGDALNMRHVITGGGMTAALNDVSFLCNILKHLNLDDTSAVTKKTDYFYKYRKVNDHDGPYN